MEQDFFHELDAYSDGFFEELDGLILEEKQELARMKKYREKSDRMLRKAQHIKPRLDKVLDFDIWKNARINVGRDFWSTSDDVATEVKRLYAKRDRLIWVLCGWYNHLIGGNPATGTWYDPPGMNKPYKFVRLCKRYDAFIDNMQERIKQEKWDAKRARVRARREKLNGHYGKKTRDPKATALATILKLRHGMYDPSVECEF